VSIRIDKASRDKRAYLVKSRASSDDNVSSDTAGTSSTFKRSAMQEAFANSDKAVEDAQARADLFGSGR
jgi:hypothetical protein